MMRRLLLILACGCYPLSVYSADNEIYIDQVGATLNLDVEQLGNSNIIGGLNAVAGSMTCLLYTSPSPRDVEESRMPSSA